jgi:hypothetical protein
MFPISMFVLITLGKCGLYIYFTSQHEYKPPNNRNCLITTLYRQLVLCAEIAFSARQNAGNERQQGHKKQVPYNSGNELN